MKHSVLASVVSFLLPAISTAAGQDLAPGNAATVNGFAITVQAVDDEIVRAVTEQSQGRIVTPKRLAEVRDSMFSGVLERMIDDRLLDEEAARRGLTATPEDLLAEMTKGFDIYILSTGLPKSAMEEQLQKAQGISFEDFLVQRAAEPDFRRAILHKRVVQTLHPEETRVTPEELEARYAERASTDFTFPTVVRASHILVGCEELDKTLRKKALETAQALHDRVAEPGADFATFASTYSTCPSKAQGGDLGYFPHEKMVKAFSDVAFALSVGSVSDVVETQFGYHVILVTDRREGRTLTLAEASDAIQNTLEVEKVERMRSSVAAKLRESASIQYEP